MAVKNWDISLRPREKALSLSIDKLSDGELLSLVLCSGPKGKNVIDYSNEILCQNDGLTGLLSKSLEQLQEIEGIGLAKACQLMAIKEIVNRMSYQQLSKRVSIVKPEDLFHWLKNHIGDSQRECLVVICLDSKSRIIGYNDLFKGSENYVSVEVKEIFKWALSKKASSIMIAHNHPSGQCHPSAQDDLLTKNIYKAAKLLNIPLKEHLVVSYDEYYSYASLGLLEDSVIYNGKER